MLTLTIISLLVALAGVGAATYKFWSLPRSISAIVYDIPKRWQWLWTAWLWVVSFTLALPLVEVMPDSYRLVAFLTVAALCFTAAMPLCMPGHERTHHILAIASGVLSQVCVFIVIPWWLTVWLVFVAVVVKVTLDFARKEYTVVDDRQLLSGRGVLLLEALCAASTYGMLLTNLPCAV